MSVYIYFFDSHKKNKRFPSTCWNPRDQPCVYDHSEIVIDNMIIDYNNGGAMEFYLNPGKRRYRYQRVRLPDIYRDVILANIETLKFGVPLSVSDYLYASKVGHCPKSALRQGFTCATFVAYVLGHPEWYTVNPDKLYNSLT